MTFVTKLLTAFALTLSAAAPGILFLSPTSAFAQAVLQDRIGLGLRGDVRKHTSRTRVDVAKAQDPPVSSSKPFHESTLTFDRRGILRETTDGRIEKDAGQVVTRFEYGSDSVVASTTFQDGYVEREVSRMDAKGRLTERAGGAAMFRSPEWRTVYQYDEFDRLVRIDHDGGGRSDQSLRLAYVACDDANRFKPNLWELGYKSGFLRVMCDTTRRIIVEEMFESDTSADFQWRRESQVDSLGRKVREVEIERSIIDTIEYSYEWLDFDSLGNAIRVVRDRGTASELDLEYEYTYDIVGNVTRSVAWRRVRRNGDIERELWNTEDVTIDYYEE